MGARDGGAFAGRRCRETRDQPKLDAAGLIAFFEENEAMWRAVAKKAYDYVKGNFPADSSVRPDDVAKALYPIIEVNEDLRTYLNAEKLKQNYWISHFTDLVIERAWAVISKGDGDAKDGAAAKEK
jgi:hypothetical protein